MLTKVKESVLWWLCLFVAPATLLGIELYHPGGFTHSPGMYQYLSRPEPYAPQFHALGYFGPHWWFGLHMIQTPMIALVAVGLWILAGKVQSADGWPAVAAAWLSGVATFVFLVYYTALDAIAGFGLGRTIEITEGMAASGQLTPAQVLGVRQVLNGMWTDRWVGGEGSFVAVTGSLAVFVAATLVAVALFLSKRAPWPSLILLVAFGWVLQLAHTMPYGPIAFGLLILAAAWIWWKGSAAVSYGSPVDGRDGGAAKVADASSGSVSGAP